MIEFVMMMIYALDTHQLVARIPNRYSSETSCKEAMREYIVPGVSYAVCEYHANTPVFNGDGEIVEKQKQTVTKNIWIDNIPAGAANGNRAFGRGDRCIMREGTPIAIAACGMAMYDPGGQTYGPECPPGIPVPSSAR